MTGREQRRVLGFAIACLVAAGLLFAGPAHPRPPVPPPVYKAIRANWKTTPERIQAFDVIACETGGAYNTTATNGQYLGLFQMGARERRLYGHGSTARAQARAAHRYYLTAGWRPWRSCA